MSRKDYFREEDKLKRISIIFGVTLVLTMVVFMLIFNLYNEKLKEDAKRSVLEFSSLNAIVPNSNIVPNITVVSGTTDKTISDVVNETKKEEIPTATSEEPIENTSVEDNQPTTLEETAKEEPQEEEPIVQEAVEPLVFIAPINGEIIKDFANETLIYSKTLDEWTTHNGIDIKAPKTTVVLASCDGVIESIKNDPRYGITVTVSHRDGFKTLYSNLLTTEFVSEGETISQGNAIGTVGESASFEIADEAHLHFEMMKDGQYVNPTLYFN